MKRALIVGIDDYPNAPLQCCVNDAKAMASVLRRNEDKSQNFDVMQKTTLSRRETLCKAIHDCFDTEVDVALFYYSGHGYVDSAGGHLVTPDCNQYDAGISMNDILAIVNQSPCKNKIIILDCCHSGCFGTGNSGGQSTATINEGVTIFTACRSSESALESTAQRHGIFTELLLEGLKGKAADIEGNITAAGLYAYIDKSLGSWGQRPVFKTNVSSFLPLRKVHPQVDVDILLRLPELFPSEDDKYQLAPSYEYTNDPSVEHVYVEPYASEEHVAIFKDLQVLESVGMIRPVGEKHMYFAAMNSKCCELTPLGKQYWELAKKEKI